MENIYSLYYKITNLFCNDKLSVHAYQKAKEEIFQLDWNSFARNVLLGYGVSLIIAGIICFFAFNWQDLQVFAKFAIIQIIIAVCFMGFYIWQNKKQNLAIACLASASMLVGVFMAVFGQYYQTGADTYTLFASWAVLILPWSIIAKSRIIWIIQLVVGYTGFVLYSEQYSLASDIISLSNLLIIASLIFVTNYLATYKPHVLSFNNLEVSLALLVFCVLCFINIDFMYQSNRYTFNYVDFSYLTVLTSVAIYGFKIMDRTTIIASACTFLGIIIFTLTDNNYTATAYLAFFLSLYCLTKLNKFINKEKHNVL